jgi:hypothetical protein
LSTLWFGSILIATLALAGAIGAQIGHTNAAINVGPAFLLALFLGIPTLVYVLDRLLASRVPSLRNSRFFVGLVGFLRSIAGLAYPQRFVLPVQLTLQSNTRPVAFLVALILSGIVIAAVGSTRIGAWQSFTLSGEFRYLEAEAIRDGFHSTYYEDMPSALDKLRGWPRVDSFNQGGSFARLFLPYYPVRDNLVLDELCDSAQDSSGKVNCLRALWKVSIDGGPVPMEVFVSAERADLGMRVLRGHCLESMRGNKRQRAVLQFCIARAMDDKFIISVY